MNLFRFFKNKKESVFRITEADREWVDENLKWLIQVYGYPGRQNVQIEFNEDSFPKTLKASQIELQNIVDDLCSLFYLDSGKITIEQQKDLRDFGGVPYEIEGTPFESDTLIIEDSYKILIANSLIENPKRLIYRFTYEFIKIRLSEDKLQYDTGEDTDLFIYLAGVYFGFGYILSLNLVDRGFASEGLWETKWNLISDMPQELMSYILAMYSILIEEDDPKWISKLPKNLKKDFEVAIAYLSSHPNPIFSKSELDANELFDQAEQDFLNNNIDEGISNLQKVLFLTTDEHLKAEVFNNIGYYQIRKGDIEKSIINFKKALEINTNFGYAYDNLGYALIRTGRIEEGWEFLKQACETNNNDKAYSYRNHALYYQNIGENGMAEKYFDLALKKGKGSVDFLELHFGEYLIEKGNKEEGMKYINVSIEKGEIEAFKN